MSELLSDNTGPTAMCTDGWYGWVDAHSQERLCHAVGMRHVTGRQQLQCVGCCRRQRVGAAFWWHPSLMEIRLAGWGCLNVAASPLQLQPRPLQYTLCPTL